MYLTPITPAMRAAEQLRISRDTLAHLERHPDRDRAHVRVAISLTLQRIAKYETLYLNCEG